MIVADIEYEIHKIDNGYLVHDIKMGSRQFYAESLRKLGNNLIIPVFNDQDVSDMEHESYGNKYRVKFLLEHIEDE